MAESAAALCGPSNNLSEKLPKLRKNLEHEIQHATWKFYKVFALRSAHKCTSYDRRNETSQKLEHRPSIVMRQHDQDEAWFETRIQRSAPTNPPCDECWLLIVNARFPKPPTPTCRRRGTLWCLNQVARQCAWRLFKRNSCRSSWCGRLAAM